MANINLMTLYVIVITLFIGVLVVAGLLILLALRNRASRNEAAAAAAREEVTRPVSLYIDPDSGHLVVRRRGRFLASSYGLPPDEKEEMKRMAEAWLVWLGCKTELDPKPPVSKPAVIAPVSAATQLNGGVTAAPAPEQASIVAQINAVVQELLPESPYADKSIQLVERPGCTGVDVWIGSQRYEGIEDVADPGIRAFLQGAVKTWEQRAEQ